jgi:two-component system cell cycle response regulator
MSSQIIIPYSRNSLMFPGTSAGAGTPSQSGMPLRVIVAEDDASSRHLLQHFLKQWGFDSNVASDGNQAWELLQSKDVPTIAIFDWVMPGLEGVELCRKVRRLSRQHYTYVLLLTSKIEKQDVIEGLGAGADDYVSKPFNPKELQARLLVAQRIISFQEQLIATREELRVQATHDFLTQLLNRAGIMDALEQELNRSDRNQGVFSVILADIDHFKQINDTYGHAAGDQVLREVAARMKASLRSYDVAGRYGGEEFLVIVPDCDEAAALRVAEKMRKSVCSTPIQILGTDRTTSISLGVSTRSEPTSADALLSAADTALYQAKSFGRNCVHAASNSGQLYRHAANI